MDPISRRALLGLTGVLALEHEALAAEYPASPIQLVVPFSAGGGTDTLARAFAEAARRHLPQPVHGYVLRGEWRYLEHDWIATEGGYVYEAPGETHTLVVDPHVEEMITLFQVNGAMIYVDPDGKNVGYDDVFTRIDKCRAHYARNGLGEGYVDQFIR